MGDTAKKSATKAPRRLRTTSSRAASTKERSSVPASPEQFRVNTIQIYDFAPAERIDLIRRGIPAITVGQIADRMHISKDLLMERLRIPRATLNRRVREHKPLSPDESERVLGLAALIGQVETMLAQSGTLEGFDVATWLSRWINLPLPALGGQKPADFLDTVEGQKMIQDLLATAQSGAYA